MFGHFRRRLQIRRRKIRQEEEEEDAEEEEEEEEEEIPYYKRLGNICINMNKVNQKLSIHLMRIYGNSLQHLTYRLFSAYNSNLPE